MRAVAVRRGKGCGRVFARGGVWYLRYRANGIERTRSTRIEVDTFTPYRLEASRRKALAVLNEETEVLRLKDRESGLRIVRSMLEDTRERLRDSMEEVRRNAPLAALQGLFVMDFFERSVGIAGFAVVYVVVMLIECCTGEIDTRRPSAENVKSRKT